MKRENYLELASWLESYEHALECRRKDPAEPLYHAAVYSTHARLLAHMERSPIGCSTSCESIR